MRVRVRKGRGAPVISVPSSKSLSHRALIAAALADGLSHLHNVAENDDTLATAEALKLLGAQIERKEPGEYQVRGIQDFNYYQGEAIDCNQSGSTLRFLIPIFAHSGRLCRFKGQGRLMERPQTVYEGLFATFEREEGQLKVQGNLAGGDYRLRGDISSQFITGLLFVLPLLDKDSRLEITEPFESRSYVILTIEILKRAGIEIEMKDNVIFIPGRQKYQPFDYRVDGDDSQAAFFICYSLMSRQPLTVEGISHDSRQGDHVILELAERFGGELRETENGYAVIPNELKAIEADLADCPDLGPILFACAGLAEGTSHFVNISRLRIKESDRLAAMQRELAKLGIEMCYDENDSWVKGVKTIREGITVNSHDDHRIAMALSVLAGCSEQGVIIEGCEAVAKSYPGFYEDINRGLMEVDCL